MTGIQLTNLQVLGVGQITQGTHLLAKKKIPEYNLQDFSHDIFDVHGTNIEAINCKGKYGWQERRSLLVVTLYVNFNEHEMN